MMHSLPPRSPDGPVVAPTSGASPVPAHLLVEVAAGGAADAGGLPVDLLGDFLPVLVAAVVAGQPISRRELRAYRARATLRPGKGWPFARCWIYTCPRRGGCGATFPQSRMRHRTRLASWLPVK